MRKFLLILLLLPTISKAQVTTSTWGVEDTVINIVKTTNYGVVHDYIEMFNYSGQDLQMRWIPAISTSWPSQWIPNFSDPDSSYTNPHLEDSADFTLLNPPEFSNKLIIGVDHQSFAANSVISFKVFPVDFPEDSIWIHYYIYIGEPEEAQVGESIHTELTFFYRAFDQQLIFSGLKEDVAELSIIDLSGKVVLAKNITSQDGSYILDVKSLKKGVFILQINSKEGLRSSFKFVKTE
ncbi:MAG: T9SS type A sorting domain-containing protein [Crocinitomicaceae bacterium]